MGLWPRVAALSALFVSQCNGLSVQITNLRTEYLENPLGLDVARPRFTWELATDQAGDDEAAPRRVTMKSYRIQVFELGQEGVLGNSLVWDSGEVASSTSYNIAYGGSALRGATSYQWTVTASAQSGSDIASATASAAFSMGLLDDSDWSGAQFIGKEPSGGKFNWGVGIAPWFRSPPFSLRGVSADAWSSALLYVASVGFCEVSVNGEPVAPREALAPSVSYLPGRVLYRVYNVTSQIKAQGNSDGNVIGLWGSPGWAAYTEGQAGWQGGEGGAWPQAPLVRAVLKIQGKSVMATCGSPSNALAGAAADCAFGAWITRNSTTQRLGSWGSDGFGGDQVDARLDIAEGWANPALPAQAGDNGWETAREFRISKDVKISSDVMEPTVRQSNVSVKRVKQVNASSVLVEMSELYTGWFEVANVTGAPGSQLLFSVSATTGRACEFSMSDSYTFGESGRGSFRMRFSYHEIHYITITALAADDGAFLAAPLAISPDQVTGWKLTSDLRRTGSFSCSSELLTRIYDTTVNNYIGLTTGGMTVDCPHRERRGYGGDGHTSYQFALANFGVGAYFTKWARDFADVQDPDTGNVPHTAPTWSGGGGPAWSGFVVTMPWQMYREYGDEALLDSMYPTMTRQLDFYAANTRGDDGLLHAWTNSQWDFLGDWITPHGSESDVKSPENILFNNAYVSYIESLTSRIAKILGKPDDSARFASRALNRSRAVNAAFYNKSTGGYVDLLQTHLVMPLATGVTSADASGDAKRAEATMTLLESAIEKTGGHLDTGLTGNYFMTKLFTETGRNDLMFEITNQTTYPSYGWFLEQGYTTWPEKWDIGTCCAAAGSKMHGCYNAVGMWFVEGVAGIAVDASRQGADGGYTVLVRPGVNTGDVEWASGSRQSLQGLVKTSWSLDTSGFRQNLTLPLNAVAKVLIPAKNPADVSESGKPVAQAGPEIKVLGSETVGNVPYLALEVGSGTYAFASTFKR